MKRVEKILKFGGSSVGSAEQIRSVIEIIEKEKTSIAIVVSAFQGVTDQLIKLGTGAALGNAAYSEEYEELIERHKDAAKKLIPESKLPQATQALDRMFYELHSVLEGVFLLKELTPKTLDLVMSFGERLSAFIISEVIPSARFLDARDVIKTDRTFGRAKVDFEETTLTVKKNFHDFPAMPIITGFIGSTKENETTTLGRGGSDYTAAIFGSALDVKVIEIWTDVDGVMTADPRKEPYAFSIPSMSYKEAMEMSYFGAKVIHPPTIIPAFEKNIPLLIKNSFNPKAPGTVVGSQSSKSEKLISGISSIDHVVLVCVQGTGIVGVCGTAKRIFGALAEKGINIILISQGSSEHSICLAISPSAADLAKEAIENEFAMEMRSHLIEKVIIERNLSVIAVVGEKMRSYPGITKRLFGALGTNGINVVAITQGSSERNITVVIKKEEEVKAIRAIHEAFFLSPKKTINVFLVGVGLIGKTLLQQIKSHTETLQRDYALDIRIIGLANSRVMAFNLQGFELGSSLLEGHQEKMDIHFFIKKMQEFNLINTVFVDCTSNQAVADSYKTILNNGISIVTPNKKANSDSYKHYKELKSITANKSAKFFYGANVGAGLPIISTIHELTRSGDKILKIEAILSGTLSYIFNTFTEDKSFSEVVLEAKKKGYTEPDPREDLKGTDVARKILILAREIGYPIEMEDVIVEEFIPQEIFQVSSIDDFFVELKKLDEHFASKGKKAKKEGKVLRYIGRVEQGRCTVSLEAVGPQHPFYQVSGNDNIVAITSEFYHESPLVIKGRGAGAEVTAGKVLGDIVNLGIKEI